MDSEDTKTRMAGCQTYVSPFVSEDAVLELFRLHVDAVKVQASGVFASAIRLGIYARTCPLLMNALAVLPADRRSEESSREANRYRSLCACPLPRLCRPREQCAPSNGTGTLASLDSEAGLHPGIHLRREDGKAARGPAVSKDHGCVRPTRGEPEWSRLQCGQSPDRS